MPYAAPSAQTRIEMRAHLLYAYAMPRRRRREATIAAELNARLPPRLMPRRRA